MKLAFKLMLACLLLSQVFPGCRKTIENIQESRIIDIMVSGKWKVTSFVVDGIDFTTEFDGYSFQYHRDKTVDAIFGGQVRNTGTWDGDVATRSVWATFDGADTPVSYLSGTWKVDNNTTTYVVISQSGKIVRLEKI